VITYKNMQCMQAAVCYKKSCYSTTQSVRIAFYIMFTKVDKLN